MENSTSTKVSNQQILAKKYIEENDIEKIISEMLNSLVHEKAKQPIVYMIKYLAGLLSDQERKDYGLIIPDPYPKGKPIVKYPDLEKSNCILKKYLNKNVWSSIKYNKTKCGGNIMNIIKYSELNSSDKIGCILVDGSSINTFNNIFAPLLAELHDLKTQVISNLDEKSNLEVFKPSREFLSNNTKSNSDNFPLHRRISDSVNKINMSYSRNLQDFPYSAIISHDKRKNVEEIILKTIKSLNDDRILKEGIYLSYSKNENEIKEILEEIDFDDNYLRTAELKTSWPDNRGIYATKERDVFILINFIDHLQIIVTAENNSDFSSIYNYSKELIQSFERNVTFDYDKFYGYLSVNPLQIGSGLFISSQIKLNNLTKWNDFRKILDNLSFDSVVISNSILKTKSFSKLCHRDELEFLEQYYNTISGLINIDKDKDNFINDLCLTKLKLDEKLDKAIYEAYEKTYEELKYQISPSGSTLNSLVRLYQENPSNELGILFTESSDYSSFRRFYAEYLKISNNLESDKINFSDKIEDNENFIQVNNPEKILSTDVCLIRNISDFPFASSKNSENLRVEDTIIKALDNLNMKGTNGKYISIVHENAEKIIKGNNLSIFHKDEYAKCGINSDFPKNRGLIIFENYNQTENSIHAVINDIDHLKFQVHIENAKLNSNFVNILKISNEFSKQLKFASDSNFGILTASGRYTGTGLILKSILKLLNLIKNKNVIEEVLNSKSFSYKILNEENGIIQITNKNSVGRSETDLMTSLISVINQLTELDK